MQTPATRRLAAEQEAVELELRAERVAGALGPNFVVPKTVDSTSPAFVWRAGAAAVDSGIPTNISFPLFTNEWMREWECDRLLALSYDELGLYLNSKSPMLEMLSKRGFAIEELPLFRLFNRGMTGMWRNIPTTPPPPAVGTQFYVPAFLDIPRVASPTHPAP